MPSKSVFTVFFIASMLSNCLSAQVSCIKFEYDNAGNRESRMFTVDCSDVTDPCDVPGGCNPILADADENIANHIEESSVFNRKTDEINTRELTSLQEKDLASRQEVVLYPNPNNGVFKIELKGFEESIDLPVVIYDPIGRVVYRKTLVDLSTTLFLDNLTAGTYILKFPSLQGKTLIINIVQ